MVSSGLHHAGIAGVSAGFQSAWLRCGRGRASTVWTSPCWARSRWTARARWARAARPSSALSAGDASGDPLTTEALSGVLWGDDLPASWAKVVTGASRACESGWLLPTSHGGCGPSVEGDRDGGGLSSLRAVGRSGAGALSGDGSGAGHARGVRERPAPLWRRRRCRSGAGRCSPRRCTRLGGRRKGCWLRSSRRAQGV